MATQEAEHSLESIIRRHHMYKYIWTPCLGERLSLHANMGNAHELYQTNAVSVIKDVRWWATNRESTVNCSAMIAVFV